ncbi:MAG: EboA domain-containing protein [Geminicoccaceae bacterium]|nr:EboA domain-containing protein [Geminicoccaceae bacterium]
MDDFERACALLTRWVIERVSAEAAAWFREQLAAVRRAREPKPLYLALGYVPRRLGKADLALSAAERAEAEALRPGFDPTDWSVDQAARIALLLASHDGDPVRFKDRLETLFRTADIGETIAFYRGLPLYPGQELLVARAREGARSGMRPVFEAVAHRNPFPKERFDENAWNHLVLKALFVGTTLAPIQGLDERANPRLARMLCDYAHERWAAGRPVSPELWRCVGPHADEAAVGDLARVLASGTAEERRAAALALSACPRPEAAELLAGVPELVAAIRRGEIRWTDFARG